MIIFKGKKYGMVHTQNITLGHIRAVFFPRTFNEKYRYLGTSIWNENTDIFRALFPLVLALDYEAKPKHCPRWFLRFLHLFGSDNSIIRVRNRKLHNLENKLTRGIMFNDYKTKWSNYDLRISISAPAHLNNLADAIQTKFYKDGKCNELVEQIKKLDPDASIIWGSISRFEKQLEKLGNKTTIK